MGLSSAVLFIFLSLIIQFRANQEVKAIQRFSPVIELKFLVSQDWNWGSLLALFGLLWFFLLLFLRDCIPKFWNIALGLCQCKKDERKAIQKGRWSSIMSPYEDRYVDVKFIDGIKGSVFVTLDEDSQQWRLFFLGLGFVLLLLPPILNGVPFYYTCSMDLGVFLVILSILFQGMKLLLTRRKKFLYFTISGSVLGAGFFVLHHFLVLISVFLLVGIVLSGAAIGFWIVKKFIISENGSINAGVAQFVKLAMLIIGTMSILQCTLDTPLALGAVVACWTICSLIHSLMSGGVRLSSTDLSSFRLNESENMSA